MKPKKAHAANEHVSQPIDFCQTPAYALDPLLPYIPAHYVVWEPAAGEGYLARALEVSFKVLRSDILTQQNFFAYEPDQPWDCIITNCPFSLKFRWLARCYALGKPFAVLLPVETIGAVQAQRLFDRYGVQVIWLSPRVNFKMPNKGWGGQAQFPTAWFTFGFNLPRDNMFARLSPRSEGQLALL